jgi:hypothetical protein
VKIWRTRGRLARRERREPDAALRPDPIEIGSSTSHWARAAQPNLLMEPNLSSDLSHDVDLTLPLLRDIGWFANSGPAGAGRAARRSACRATARRRLERP